MFVMTQGGGFLVVNVLAQGCSEKHSFYIRSSQDISSQKSMNIPSFHHPDKGLFGILDKGNCRTQNPDNKPMLPFKLKQVIELIIVKGKRGLSSELGSKGKLVCSISI